MVSYVFFIGCKSRTNNGKLSILAQLFREVYSVDFGILELGNWEISCNHGNFPISQSPNSKIPKFS
ncbi:MAG: hypothetical protein JWQ30_1317 [Sediminibacterium sp.]|nr:hypothetical protein [Sediminibacterium sp.]